jgi:hypothetical protein
MKLFSGHLEEAQDMGLHLWLWNVTHSGDDAVVPVDDIEGGVSAAFLVDGFVYALLAGGALVQFVRNCWRYRPWTVQKMLHLLMFVATFGTRRSLSISHLTVTQQS